MNKDKKNTNTNTNNNKINNLNIIYEDNHIIVLEKPVNIPSQGDKTGDLDLLTMVKDYLKKKYNKPGNVYLGLVHRLDRPTGGLMVFAKTSKAASRLSEEIRQGRMEKKYRAIVKGNIDDGSEMVDYLRKNTKLNKSFVTNNKDSNGKFAKLEYKKIRYIKENNTSIVDIKLLTGRHHQIRVQFSSRGHPIYADSKYDKPYKNQNLKLYAYYLSFKHPVRDEVLKFEYIPEEYK